MGALEPGRALRGRASRAALLALVGGLLAARLVSVFHVAANWDELALLHRADQAVESGIFQSGGRPGLAVLVLVPFVAGCDDEIAVVRAARLLWLAVTLAYLAGVAAWVAALQPDARRRRGDALLALALLALVPAFLEWSLQVRSDQLALACAAWGGAALLASRRRLALAAAAGALFALGVLASQKALYAVGLAGLLAAGAAAGPLRPGRDAARLALSAAAALAVWLGFRLALTALFDVPAGHAARSPVAGGAIGRSLSIFDFYRETIGFDQYRELLPTLAPHGILLAALVGASVAARRRGSAGRPRLALAWAVLASGAFVAWFHSAAFAYFWMTLGLFPAVAFALAREPLERLLPTPRAREPLERLLPTPRAREPLERLLPTPRARELATGALALALLAPALLQAGWMLADSQAVQRESFDFVHRNLDKTDAGFHPESGLFCQLGGPPIQTQFSQTIYRHFAGEKRAANTERMVRTFRDQPVKFMLQSFRLNQFPVELRRFWAEHYQPYRASVFLAGRELAGGPGEASRFELIVPGRYRWIPFEGPRPLEVDGARLAAGAVLELAAGPHEARFPEERTAGLLVLAVDDPPGPAPLAFYKAY